MRFKYADRLTPTMFPPSIEDWVDEGHLSRFVVEIIGQLDLSPFESRYRGSGTEAYHPSVLLGLLFYGYATGIFSSRKLAQATYDLIPVRYICGDLHPDHDTIATFRKKFLEEITEVFKQILVIAHEMKVLRLGTISLDGTKMKANASKHKALSWEYANKLEQQMKAEVNRLMKMAEASDNEQAPELDIPDEIKRREDRLARICAAKKEIQARSKARYDEEKKAYDAKMKDRESYEEETGKKPRGKPPEPPKQGPRPQDQVNLTDAESRIMPSSKGFEQAYNAQAAVDIDSQLIIENHVSQKSNDKKEIEPTLGNINNLPDKIGRPENILSDSGYFSEANVNTCEAHHINPYISQNRDKHNSFLRLITRSELTDSQAKHGETPLEKMRQRLATEAGKKLYGKRKSTVEPVFGIVKHVLGFRQFMLRGKEKVAGEWNLICTAFNIKRMHTLCAAMK